MVQPFAPVYPPGLVGSALAKPSAESAGRSHGQFPFGMKTAGLGVAVTMYFGFPAETFVEPAGIGVVVAGLGFKLPAWAGVPTPESQQATAKITVGRVASRIGGPS